MAHKEQREFVMQVKKLYPQFFDDKKVLGIGTFNAVGTELGTEKHFFSNCEFIGLDIGPGEGVDIVCPAQEYNAPGESFDTIISCECWEHNPFYEESIQNAVRLLKSGGLFLFTCATTGRPIHGTSTQDAIDQSRGYTNQGNLIKSWTTMPNVSRKDWNNDYYKNITEQDIRHCIDVDDIFSPYAFSINLDHSDLYFWGIKK